MTENTRDPPVYLTPTEAATILRLSPVTVRLWIRQGIIPAKKVGRRKWFIPRAAVYQMLEPAK